MQGYAHPTYAASLSDFGLPRYLPDSGGWILERLIAGVPCHDAMGCYPIFACQNWGQLRSDVESLADLVCLSLVTDPFGEYDVAYLEQCFPAVVKPFKEHFVVDLARPLSTFANPQHLRKARRARAEIEIECCEKARDFLDDWSALYAVLTERHGITGIAAFSRDSFAQQLAVPGMTAFRAIYNGATVGMLLWYAQGSQAYYHLGAYSEVGYERRASFALFSHAIEYFASQGFAWLNLGAGAGVNAANTGLTRFKQGWSTGTRTAYFCGRIFDAKKYQELVAQKNVGANYYFPAYRAGEFS